MKVLGILASGLSGFRVKGLGLRVEGLGFEGLILRCTRI